MKKDEILNASRKEHRNKDLAEMEVVYQAGSHASRVGVLVCCLPVSYTHLDVYKRQLKYSTEKNNFRQFNHTGCKKRNDHSQRKPGLYWIITG